MPVNKRSWLKEERLDTTLRHYRDALSWLESKGFNVNASRLSDYDQNYQKLLDNWGKETFREIINNKSYSSAVYEIYEIIQIHEKLIAFDSKEVNESIKKILSGVELYEDDDSKKNRLQHVIFLLSCTWQVILKEQGIP